VPVTVTLQVAVFPPSTVVAKMVAVPALTPVTTPVVLFIVAIEVSLLVHVTLLLVASAGSTAAVSVMVLFTPTVRFVAVILTPVTGLFAASSTSTVQAAVFPPSSVLTVMVTLPFFLPVTTPLLFTVAIASLLLFQITFLLVASDGSIVAYKVVVSFALIPTFVADKEIPDTAFVTVTSQVPDSPPAKAAAVIVVVPLPTAVTVPF
jgi:hypothetical protein